MGLIFHQFKVLEAFLRKKKKKAVVDRSRESWTAEGEDRRFGREENQLLTVGGRQSKCLGFFGLISENIHHILQLQLYMHL